jgi:thiamine biosynthesis lipoprotein
MTCDTGKQQMNIILLIGFCLSCGLFEPAQMRFDYSQRLMGISFDVSVYASSEKVANETVEAAYTRVRQLNAIFSDYEPDSELNRLCKTAGTGQAVAVSPELWALLVRSAEYSKQSDGAFDVTVGPLVRLWRKARKSKVLPTPEQILAAQKLVGYEKIRFDHEKKTVELTVPGMQLDLGGIAVGFVCDDIQKIFHSRGLNRFMIDASGDLLLGDPPPDEAGWKIGVAPLLNAEDAPPSRHVLLRNAAVSTSGDAFQHVEFNGIRYSHIVDPKTGLGLTDRSTVVVIAKDCTAADALSTTVSVLGPERGLKLLTTQPDTAALIVRATIGRDQPEIIVSPNFEGFVTK